MQRLLMWIWFVLAGVWFAVNAAVIDPKDFSFWLVATLPFWIGVYYLIAMRTVMGGWRRPPDPDDFWDNHTPT